jgi:hypothetical protein
LGSQGQGVIDPHLGDLGIDGMVADRLAEDLEPALEVAAEDR